MAIQKLADGKDTCKGLPLRNKKQVMRMVSFDEKHPDFPAGKRLIITHLAAAGAKWIQ